jgi:DUF4097 and DUF4098 domain-containing protein YvlB
VEVLHLPTAENKRNNFHYLPVRGNTNLDIFLEEETSVNMEVKLSWGNLMISNSQNQKIIMKQISFRKRTV